MAFKPDGYTSVAPYLIVASAQKTLDFAKAVFNADQLRVFHHDDGAIMHAEMRIDDTVVMMGEAPGAAGAHIHIYVPEVDTIFARAIAAGGSVAQEVMEKGDGDRRGGVTDPNGTTWWLSTQLD